MTAHDLGSLGVGKVLTTREFAVGAADLTAHAESAILERVLGTAEEWLSTGSIAGASAGSSASAWGRVCPTSVAVDRVLSALGVLATRRSVGRMRALGEILVGEPLTATAEVRYRSARNPGAIHVTLEVEVHRWLTGRRVTVLGFEVGLELPAEPAAA
jgi:hypothetical protein